MSHAEKLSLGPDRELVVPALLGSLLFLYFVLPLVAFLGRTGAVNVVDGLSTPAAREAIRNSLITAPISTAIATLLGVPLAYVLARYSFPGKRLVEAVVVLPLVLPPVVGGVMLLTAVGRLTPIGVAANAVGLPLTNSLLGVVLAQVFVAAPFLVVAARAGFGAVDERLERASRSLGRGPLGTFFHVSLPMARRAIVAGIVLTFARAVGEFGATLMVAYNPRTMPTQIWVAFFNDGIDGIVPLALALLAVTVVVVAAIQHLGRTQTVIDR